MIVTVGMIALTTGCSSSVSSKDASSSYATRDANDGTSRDSSIGDTGSAAPSSVCVGDWVVPASLPTYEDSLVVDAPKLLWSLSIPNASDLYGGGPVLAGDRLALTTATQVLLVTKNGSSTQDVTQNLPTISNVDLPWSAPTTDPNGNVYVVGQPGIGSLTSNGDLRWIKEYPWKNPVVYNTLYNRDGSIETGPAVVHGSPQLVGADGSIYTADWAATGNRDSPCALRIIAYARDLTETWRIDVPSGCRDIYGEVLDRDGVLYISTNAVSSEAMSLYAIQTRSPGLARSSWPSGRHDNQGTQWMEPPTQDQTPVDADRGSSVDGGFDVAQ
jgi:hypothetical protein